MNNNLRAIPIVIMLMFQLGVSTVKAESLVGDKLLKTYELRQRTADLRLYYMVKSRLKTRNDRIYFLNLSLRDKKIYTKYLLENSDVRFQKKRGYSLFF